MISIVIAIQSLWACKILNGEKTIEVRKGLALYNALKKAEEMGEEVEFLMYVTKAKPYLDYIEQYDDDSGYWYQGEYHLDYDELRKLPKSKKGMTEDDPLFDDYTYNDMVLSMRKARKDGSLYDEHYYNLNGKVVAKFKAKAEEIYRFTGLRIADGLKTDSMKTQELLDASCLTYKQLYDYLYENKPGTALHIEDLEIFDKPKELSEFFHGFKLKNNGAIAFDHDNKALRQRTLRGYEYVYPLSRAPQSWCYVQEAKL